MVQIFVDAAIISILLYSGVFLMIKINPRSQLHNYPEQIRRTVPAKSVEDKQVMLAVGMPMLVLLVSYVVVSSYLRFHGTDIGYWQVLARWVAVYLLTSAIDLFICDYLIFCTITPRFIVIPGTEGNPGYKDKSYHTRGIPSMILISIALGALSSLTYLLK